jgi:hypothetical protein
MIFIHPRKLLAFAFWELRRILSAISDDGGSLDWRAMGLLGMTQVGLILSLFELSSLMLGRSLFPARGLDSVLFCLLLAGTIQASNNYALRYDQRLKTFEREFEQYSTLRKTIGCVVMILLPPLTIATTIWGGVAVSRLPH